MSILPTQRLASLPIVGAMFIPPTPVRDVAAAACAAVYDDSVSPGIKSVVRLGGWARASARCFERCLTSLPLPRAVGHSEARRAVSGHGGVSAGTVQTAQRERRCNGTQIAEADAE